MTTTAKTHTRTRRALIPALLLVGAGCSPMSEQVEDPAVGTNGGFEPARSGLPVNWIVYSPATIPKGSYRLGCDRDDKQEKEQSLGFDVQECSAAGGWHSPGIAQEYPAEPGATYTVRFWIKSEGCDWTVDIGGVGAKTGEPATLASSELAAGAWTLVEREYLLPPRYDRLRFELSLTSPGCLWIDDVRIDRTVARDDREGARGAG